MIITTPRVAAAVAMPNSKDEVGRVSMPTTRLLPGGSHSQRCWQLTVRTHSEENVFVLLERGISFP